MFKAYEISDTMLHNFRVGMLSYQFAFHLGLGIETATELLVAGMFHDIGKFKIDRELLNKPGKLNEKEYEIVKKHLEYSVSITRALNFDEKIIHLIENHHENFDQTGYYNRKPDVPSMIIRMADFYDSLTSNRVYRDAFDRFEALEIMKENSNCFEPVLFTQFCMFLEPGIQLNPMAIGF